MEWLNTTVESYSHAKEIHPSLKPYQQLLKDYASSKEEFQAARKEDQQKINKLARSNSDNTWLINELTRSISELKTEGSNIEVIIKTKREALNR